MEIGAQALANSFAHKLNPRESSKRSEISKVGWTEARRKKFSATMKKKWVAIRNEKKQNEKKRNESK